MPYSLQEIVEFLNTYLDIYGIEDASWNGLQFEGKERVKKITGAVDACLDSIQEAARHNADMLITHHGHFWHGVNPSYTGWSRKRLAPLYYNNLSLYVAHLPLDKHQDIGNNAQLIKLLGAQVIGPFYQVKTQTIGWIGSYTEPMLLDTIVETLNNNLPTTCTVLPFGKKSISTFAICSGAAGYKGFTQALEAQVDLFITGEPFDIYNTAKDSETNVVFAGHNATERIGIKALLNVLSEKFDVETHFIDLRTGL